MSVASLDEVMIEGSVGAPGRTDCDRGEVQLSDGVGGDGGGYGGLLPVRVGVIDEVYCTKETTEDHKAPQNLAWSGLGRRGCGGRLGSPGRWRCRRGRGWWRTPGTPSGYPSPGIGGCCTIPLSRIRLIFVEYSKKNVQ